MPARGVFRHLIIAGAIATCPDAALAQSAENVVTEAEDAFGERIGIERIGLYSESQVRGFSLAEAGNYRIEGAYFVRAAGLGNPVAAGITTRVGFNALSAEFPAPSGIVDHRLRHPNGNRLDVEAGIIEFGGGYANLIGSAQTGDGRFGIAGGAALQPHRHFASGARGSQYDFGVVPEWRINDTSSITGMLNYGTLKYWGEFLHNASDEVLPPKIHFPSRYTGSWGAWDQRTLNGGVIGKTRIGEWNFQASGFYSRNNMDRSDYTLHTLNAQGVGTMSGVYARPRTADSISGEIKIARSLGSGQRIYAILRQRRSESELRPGVVFDMGPITYDQRVPPSEAPIVPPVDPTIDLVRQTTAGVGYEARIGQRLQVRGGIQRTRYRKSIAMPGLPVNLNDDSTWVYDAAAVFSASERWTVFATATRGVEESGSAPANAVNRYAVLAPVVARQYELGFRGRIGEGLSLIGSVFEVSKPTAGLAPSGVYDLIAEETHRGVELSLTGTVLPRLTTVAGVVVLDPVMSGTLVNLGEQPKRAMGVSSVVGVASFNYEAPFLSGLSIDGQFTYNGSRLIHPTNGLETPSYPLFDLGGRYRFALAGKDAVLRVYGSNIFARNEWTGTRSGSFLRTAPRALRATVTVTLN